jgi:hypothetical protein
MPTGWTFVYANSIRQSILVDYVNETSATGAGHFRCCDIDTAK